MLAESVPPAQLVGQRIWVEGHGAGEVLNFEKAFIGFGTSTHTVRFDEDGELKVKLRRHGNGKTPFILLNPTSLTRPAKTVFRYTEDPCESGSEPVTPSEGSVEGSLEIPGTTQPRECLNAPGSLVEHLEHQAWDICARIANPQSGYASSAFSESLSESPSFAFSCTPPESVIWRQMQNSKQPGSTEDPVKMSGNTSSKPMAIPQRGGEPLESEDHEICRVDHLLSESGTIFTPGEHKWICEASPPQNAVVNMMMQGAPPQVHREASAEC